MRERGKKKDGQRNVIPPQIFNGQEFRGVSKTKDAPKVPFVNWFWENFDDDAEAEF